MNQIVERLKEAGEDHEFYPTTDEIIRAVVRDVGSLGSDSYYSRANLGSFLDIGAGNGKVLRAIQNNEEWSMDRYAIEKSQTLRGLLDDGVYIIGTDFYEQSLLDKHIDITFCNPPYSDFKTWAEKIIRESASHTVYLVIPSRWKDSQPILDALKYREAKHEVIGEYSFQDAEDRQARAKVDLIRVELSDTSDDAFDRLFDTQFEEFKFQFKDKAKKESQFTHLVTGEGYVKSLVQMYREELKSIRGNYEKVSQLDADLLREFDVFPEKVLKCLKERTKGLKSLYWDELIGRMKEITDRLITKKRNELFQKLQSNGNVDFTEGNIYAVVLWILHHSGECIDSQLIETYDMLLSKTNCRNYKSNQKVYEGDKWRYRQEKPTHVYLDYRLVYSGYNVIEAEYSGDYRIGESAADYLRDLLTVANNLGFHGNTADERLYSWGNGRAKLWRPGVPQEFTGYHNGKQITIMEVKLHKNGNMHIRLNQKFALSLNVEYGRLKGWIHNKGEASTELKDTNAATYYRTNFSMLESPFLKLEAKPVIEDVEPEPEYEEVAELF